MVEHLAGRLREVTLRPTVGSGERQRWDALMSAHHYLPFRGLGRGGAATRRGPGRALAGAHGLARRGGQAQGAR